MFIRFTLAIAGTLLALPSVAAQETPADSYVETRLTGDGEFVTSHGGDGREGALYQTGSISKFMCSIAALKMQQDGLFSLDDSIAKLLPGYTGAHAKDTTFRDLLANRTGIRDGLMIAARTDPDSVLGQPMTALEAANRFGTDYTGAKPGTAFDYVITNWSLVQAILERADGKPIDEILNRRVLQPAGMTHSTIFIDNLPGGADAVQPVGHTLALPSFLRCAGGLAATPADLIRLLRYPYHGSDISPASRTALETVTSPEEGYTLGGRVHPMEIGGKTHLLSWQSGSNGAFKSRAVYDPVSDTGYAIVTNSGDAEMLERRRDAWAQSIMHAE